jgi:hypothetical protein
VNSTRSALVRHFCRYALRLIVSVDELIRQVAIACQERGLLLLRVRDEIRMSIAADQTLYESSVAFGMRKALQAEQGKSDLENKVLLLLLLGSIDGHCHAMDKTLYRKHFILKKRTAHTFARLKNWKKKRSSWSNRCWNSSQSARRSRSAKANVALSRRRNTPRKSPF